MDSEALLQRVDALFHASGCATDAQALTELATQGADGAASRPSGWRFFLARTSQGGGGNEPEGVS